MLINGSLWTFTVNPTDRTFPVFPDVEDEQEGEKFVENEFLNYLETEFFSKEENACWILEIDGIWVSALRLFYIREGEYYIEALETHPDYRKRGYGSQLILEMLEALKKRGTFVVSDMVSKKNTASLNTHKKCGFNIFSDPGLCRLTGKTNEREFGLEYRYEV